MPAPAGTLDWGRPRADTWVRPYVRNSPETRCL